MLQDLNKALFSEENSIEKMTQSSQNDSDEHESTQTKECISSNQRTQHLRLMELITTFLSGYLIAFSAFY